MDQGHPLSATRRAPGRIFAAALAALFALAGTVSARVYWGTGNAPETAGVIAPDPAWTRAYGTMVRINGGRGGLEVWHSRFAVDDAVGQLAEQVRAAGGVAWFTGGGELAWGFGCVGERVYRFLLSAGDAPGQCLVYQLSQDTAAFRASLVPPAEHLIRAAPAAPGSSPRSYFALEDSGLELATANTAAPVADIQQFYAGRLGAQGWKAPLQPGRGADLYVRDRELLLLRSESTGEGAGSLIILIHKSLGAKPPG